MPPTWAELRDCLAALLDRFEYNTPTFRDEDRVKDAARRWIELADDVPPLPSKDAERTELLGLLRRLGPTLADLDAPLQQLLQGPSDLLDSTGSQVAPALSIFQSATNSLSIALVVAKDAGATAEDLIQLGCCTRLLLGTGRLVAAWAAEVVQLSASPADARKLFSHVIASQLYVLTTIIGRVARAGLLDTFAAQSLPPHALLPWLRAVANMQQSVPVRPGEKSPLMAPRLGLLMDHLCLTKTMEPHREALAADAALCSSLVCLLLRSLGKAAVALRLPHDRRPEVSALDPIESLAKLLMSPTLRPALDRHLQLADSPAVLRLVHQAATVLQHLPSAPPAGCTLLEHTHAHLTSIGLLSAAVAEARERAEPAVCQPLPPTLPQLATALQLAAAVGDGRITRLLCNCWTGVLTAMNHSVLEISSASLPAEKLLAAVTVLLSTLPTAATCAQQHAQPSAGQAAAQAEGRQSVATVAQTLLVVVKTFLLQLQPGRCDPSLMAAAHEACCHAIHWAAACPESTLLLPRQRGGLLLPLLGMLSSTANVVASARQGCMTEPASPLRALQGTCAAHWAAVQAATAAGGASLLKKAESRELASLAASLFFCAKAGPRAVGSSTELLALSDQLLRSLLAGLPEEEPDWLLCTVLADERSAPGLAAHLVAGGTLEVVASGLPRRPGPHRASPLQAFLVAAAEAALEEVQHAGATELGTAGTSSDIAQAVQKLLGSLEQLRAAVAAWSGDNQQPECLRPALQRALPPAAQVAAALQAHWQRADAEPERQQAARLELAQAAATRASCAHLACPDVGATGRRGKLCTGCRVARYCCRACSVADWQAGHRATCRLLAAACEAGSAAEEAAAG